MSYYRLNYQVPNQLVRTTQLVMLDQRRARLVRLSSAKLNQQQIAELQNQTEYLLMYTYAIMDASRSVTLKVTLLAL